MNSTLTSAQLIALADPDTDPDLFVDDLLALNDALFGTARMGDDAGSDGDGDGDDGDAGSDGDDGDAGSDGDGDGDGSDGDGSDGDGDKPLGEAGQKALEAIKKRDKANRAKLRAQSAEIARLKAAGKSGKAGQSGKDGDDGSDQQDPEEIRKEARAEADAAILQTRVMDKIEAKAGGRFALEPEDVAALLMRRHAVEDFLDENNQIDMGEIEDALNELLKNKPNLAAKGSKRFNGGGDGGRRKDKAAKPKSLGEALTRHYSNSNT